jgi:hypothetical protein
VTAGESVHHVHRLSRSVVTHSPLQPNSAEMLIPPWALMTRLASSPAFSVNGSPNQEVADRGSLSLERAKNDSRSR